MFRRKKAAKEIQEAVASGTVQYSVQYRVVLPGPTGHRNLPVGEVSTIKSVNLMTPISHYLEVTFMYGAVN